MRKRRRRGVSLGTLVTLLLTAMVGAGCLLLFPRLMGNIGERVDAQRVSVALDASLRGLGQSVTSGTQSRSPSSLADSQMEAMPSPAPTASPSPLRTLTLTATGSISVDTPIQKACTGAQGYAFTPLLEALTGSFQSDLNLATLENLTMSTEKLTDVNMPVDALAALQACGLNTLSTGFYGALNCGVQGLQATHDALLQLGITPYGAYPSAESRSRVVTVDVNGLRVALLSFQGELSAAGKKRTTSEEQAFVIAPLTLPVISQEIAAARAAGAQVVIVSLCWGKAGANAPSGTQQELARGIAAAGADLILGTHSGTLQPLELITSPGADGTTRQTLCAYSLGNLLQSDRERRETISGALLHVSMTYDASTGALRFDTLSYTPTYVWRGKLDGKTAYRVLPGNVTPPDYVDAEQRKVMERCVKLVRDALAGSPVVEAQP